MEDTTVRNSAAGAKRRGWEGCKATVLNRPKCNPVHGTCRLCYSVGLLIRDVLLGDLEAG